MHTSLRQGTSFCPGLWLAVSGIVCSSIGCFAELWNGKLKKKILSTEPHVGTFVPHLCRVSPQVNIEVRAEKAQWGASSRRNPKESPEKKMVERRQPRTERTRFPLATTSTKPRSSTAGIREKRWGRSGCFTKTVINWYRTLEVAKLVVMFCFLSALHHLPGSASYTCLAWRKWFGFV